MRSAVLIAASLGAAVLFAGSREPELALASSTPGFSIAIGDARLRAELGDTRGRLDLATAQLERLERVVGFSSRFGIPANLATTIHDVALAEGIDPDLAFRIVALESRFNPRATSSVGAAGLAQVMLPTARYFQPDITREQLYEPETNLRIGFRYLRTLLRAHGGDLRIALLIYNRGPVAVGNALSAGEDPGNGYERVILSGYAGTGLVD